MASAGAAAQQPERVEFTYYTEHSGTSMAAPHVLRGRRVLSIRREFIANRLR